MEIDLWSRVNGYVVFGFGRPGSGKDTQLSILAEWIKQNLKGDNIHYFVCSQHLNWRRQANDHLANQIANAFNERGTTRLLPNKIVCEMMSEYFDCLPPRPTVVLNGFPRDHEQVLSLRKVVGRHSRLVAVELEISREAALQRIAGRAEGRKEDNPIDAAIRQDIYDHDVPGIRQGLREMEIPTLVIDASPSKPELVQRDIQSRLIQFFQTPAESHAIGQQVFAPAVAV